MYTDGVVSPGVVVGRVLLSAHQLLGVEQLPVGSSSNLVHHSGLQVDEDCPAEESFQQDKINFIRNTNNQLCYTLARM